MKNKNIFIRWFRDNSKIVVFAVAIFDMFLSMLLRNWEFSLFIFFVIGVIALGIMPNAFRLRGYIVAAWAWLILVTLFLIFLNLKKIF